MKYVWGLNIDDLIAFEDGAGNHYYVAKDKVGSIRNVATRSGTWIMRLRHRPYGTLIDSVGTGVMLRYRWTGREWDAELGWYFMRARHYDPVVSRFTQEDPIGFAGGSNLYAYAGGSPLEARDPMGLKAGNVDGPFEGFCFGGGSCVNWDGTVTHGGSGWSFSGGGGGFAGLSVNRVYVDGKYVGSVVSTPLLGASSQDVMQLRIGKLTVYEHLRVSAAIKAIPNAEIQADLRSMLDKGKILGASRRDGKSTEFDFFSNFVNMEIIGSRNIGGGTSVFDLPNVDLAFGLLHDMAHIYQVRGRSENERRAMYEQYKSDRGYRDFIEAGANGTSCLLVPGTQRYAPLCR